VSRRVAENYERYLVPAFFARWAVDLIECARLRPGQRVLDVGCGTGVVTRMAAQRHPGIRMVGIDRDPAYLAVARSAAGGGAVEWLAADASSMPFEDESFEVVLCQQALQFFEDRLACLEEMRRVLVDKGTLVLSVWSSIERSPGFGALAAGLERRVGVEARAALAEGPFCLPDADELEALARLAGLQAVSVVSRERPARFPSVEDFVHGFLSAYPIEQVGTGGEAVIAAVSEDVRASLGEAERGKELIFPIVSNVLTARR
jgi:SAM-dependent methyltransferase